MPKKSQHSDPKKRRWSRQFALQSLYQWEISKTTVDAIEAQFLNDENASQVDWEDYSEILHAVPSSIDEIDKHIKRYIARKLEDIDPIELTILRVATYELLHRLDVPHRVILNEALELAKSFGATDGHKFVNGILDKIAREVRVIRLQHPHA